jgi:hypothetical protein
LPRLLAMNNLLCHCLSPKWFECPVTGAI